MAKKNDDKNEEVAEEQATSNVSDVDDGALAGPANNQDEVDKLRRDFEELEARFNVAQDQLKRALADYQNLEKRINEGKADFASWANAELIKRIVPVLDHFDKALSGGEDGNDQGWRKGVEMAVKELKRVLEEEGLSEVEIDTFDPNLHEAIEVAEGEDGKIIKVLEKGYTLNGKILKPAKVVVGGKT